MRQFERRQQLLQRIHSQGRQSVDSLAGEFGVSVQTLRGDIRHLADKGLVLRRQGEVLPFPEQENIGYDQRQIVNVAGKRQIAARAASLVQDHQALFLGTGTTVEQLADALSDKQGLHIMTNNLHALIKLCQLKCELVVAGGRVRRRDQDVIGGDAWRFFQRYRADVGIVSVGGMDSHGQLYDYNDDEVMAREALLAHSSYRVLVLDKTKFDLPLRCSAGRLSDYDAVVTDVPLPDKLRSPLAAQGVRFMG
ncbi:DeoR/GlpR family DNA-binding transcription regulator [Vreelandella neptunia]|uniref:DeoR/GlpR family DNA-binding transcription regulator n=1 Tax=Vreelandella neptunia TaxID=115551 RepID=A0ABS9S629_9GAMM|nr:DeoR/GlpR family DNA-binding transcription regulator [Halomonas neptunia]MCH4811568.1 DeoR/GlpR family DNA-binding transcription regulator [Halomonas neptunia]